jgi:hypothetical protein
MSDIDDAMIESHIIAEIYNAFKPQIGDKDEFLVWRFIRKDIAKIIGG